MRSARKVWALAALALVLVLAACGQTPAPAPSRNAPSITASSSATSGALVYSLSVRPVTAAVNDTITAAVLYRNTSADTTLTLVGPGGALYNVRATSGSGTVVFDSFQRAGGAIPRPAVPLVLGPGQSASSTIAFRLASPGRYSVVAFMESSPGLITPPVAVVVR
jgi:ABC-type glycerol-3-phosphate transport system substrate-binding protein